MWLRLAFWFVPLGDPLAPASIGAAGGFAEASWALQSADILWYLRTYFWFMLLSPLLLRVFRLAPWRSLLAPLVLLALLDRELVVLPGPVDSVVWDFCTFAPCWLLGFALHDGSLRRVPTRLVLLAGTALMALGLAWVLRDGGGWDLGTMPVAQALWSLGFCGMLLRVSPSWSSLPRALRLLRTPIGVVNQRAVTIYLWHCLVLMALVPLIDLFGRIGTVSVAVPWLYGEWTQFLLVWPALALVVVAVGWVEDVAARRPPRLWPVSAERPPTPEVAVSIDAWRAQEFPR